MTPGTLIQHVDDLIANKVVNTDVEGIGTVHLVMDDRPGISISMGHSGVHQTLLTTFLSGYTTEDGVNYIVIDAALDPSIPPETREQFDLAAQQGFDLLLVYVQFLALVVHRMIQADDHRVADRRPPPADPNHQRYPVPYDPQEYDRTMELATTPAVHIHQTIPPTLIPSTTREPRPDLNSSLPPELRIKTPEYVTFHGHSSSTTAAPLQSGNRPSGNEHDGPILTPEQYQELANGRLVLAVTPELEVRLHAAPAAIAMVLELIPRGQEQGIIVLEAMIQAFTDTGNSRTVTVDIGADNEFLANSSRVLAHLPGDAIDNTTALYALYLPYLLHTLESRSDPRVAPLQGATPPETDPGCRRFAITYEPSVMNRWLQDPADVPPLRIRNAKRT